jgi:hypothetical protein
MISDYSKEAAINVNAILRDKQEKGELQNLFDELFNRWPVAASCFTLSLNDRLHELFDSSINIPEGLVTAISCEAATLFLISVSILEDESKFSIPECIKTKITEAQVEIAKKKDKTRKEKDNGHTR